MVTRDNGWTTIAKAYRIVTHEEVTLDQLAERLQMPRDWVEKLLDLWSRAQLAYAEECARELPRGRRRIR